MGKEVGSVDLEELVKARQELNAERGIQNDPNMYSDYNPNRKQEELDHAAETEKQSEVLEQEKPATDEEGESFGVSENVKPSENDDEIVINPLNVQEKEEENLTREKDFSVYDNFAAFDISGEDDTFDQQQNNLTDAQTSQNDESTVQTSQNDESEVQTSKNDESEVSKMLDEYEINSKTQAETPENDEDTKRREKELMALLGFDEPETSENDETASETQSESLAASASSGGSGSEPHDENLYEGFEKDLEEILSLSDGDALGFEDKTIKNSEKLGGNGEVTQGNSEKDENSKSYVDYVGNTLREEVAGKFEKQLSNVEGRNASLENFETTEPLKAEDKNMSFAENFEKSEEASKQKIREVLNKFQENEGAEFLKINDIDYIDAISSKQFEDLEKLGFVLGRAEDGKVEYSSVKDLFNIAVFSKNETNLFKFFGSIILSHCLKCNTDEIRFALCDCKNHGIFEVYENSSYLFGQLTKNSDEAIKLLKNLVNEIDERYEAIAKSGTKNIDEYNAAMEEVRFVGLPYIMLLVPNLEELSGMDSLGSATEPLTYILKYGRLVGVFAYIASSSQIVNENINFNLSTRVAFKADDAAESSAWIGEASAEQLPEEDEYILKSMYLEQAKHYKVPELDKRVAKLLMENIEG